MPRSLKRCESAPPPVASRLGLEAALLERRPGELHDGIGAAQLVGAVLERRLRLELALGGVGRVRERVEHHLALLERALVVARAHLEAHVAAVGDDVARDAAGDRADVRGRLVVEPAEAHLGQRVAQPRRSRCGPPRGRCRRAPSGRGTSRRSSTATGTPSRGRRSARRGRRRSRCAPSNCEQSSALTPCRPVSSCTLRTSSMPACGRPSATMRRTPSSIAATAALLSPPRIVSSRLVTTPSATTGSMAAVGSTVSTCAQSRIGRAGLARGRRDAADDVAGLVARAAAADPRSDRARGRAGRRCRRR